MKKSWHSMIDYIFQNFPAFVLLFAVLGFAFIVSRITRHIENRNKWSEEDWKAGKAARKEIKRQLKEEKKKLRKL